MNEKVKSFGQGLESVFWAKKLLNYSDSLDSQKIDKVNVNNIVSNKYQPRKNFDSQELNKLTNSVKEHGILQPILVREQGEGLYEIIAGERRYRAAKLVGLQHVPAVIINVDNSTSLVYALIENIQRHNLDSIEEANSYLKLHKDFGYTHDEISKLVGRSRTVITNSLRLLSLSHRVQEMITNNKINTSQARALVGLGDKEQNNVVDTIISNKLCTRDVENITNDLKNKAKEKYINSNLAQEEEIEHVNLAELFKIWSKKLSNSLKTSVKFKYKPSTNDYCLSVSCKSLQEIEDFYKLLDKGLDNKDKTT